MMLCPILILILIFPLQSFKMRYHLILNCIWKVLRIGKKKILKNLGVSKTIWASLCHTSHNLDCIDSISNQLLLMTVLVLLDYKNRNYFLHKKIDEKISELFINVLRKYFHWVLFERKSTLLSVLRT